MTIVPLRKEKMLVVTKLLFAIEIMLVLLHLRILLEILIMIPKATIKKITEG